MKKQIYLEAIRGLAALIVVVTHYFSAFYPAAIYGAVYQYHESWEALFTTTPLGLVFASKFAVALFFVLSGYVLSRQFFGDDARSNIDVLTAMIKRPFRLAGLVLFSELVSFCLLQGHGYLHVEVSEISHSIPWFRDSLGQEAIGVGRFLTDIVVRAFAAGPVYNPPLWTIEIELYGSFLTFLFVFFFRKNRFRLLAYGIATLFCHNYAYQGFIFGIWFADFSRNHRPAMMRLSNPPLAWSMLIVGLVLASRPEHIPSAAMENRFFRSLPQLPFLGWGYPMLSAALVFFSLLLNPGLQTRLSSAAFAFLGRVSYALYAVHFLVLASVSSWLFLQLQPRLGYNLAFLSVFSTSLVVLLFISHLLSRYVDQPAIKAASFVAGICRRKLGANASKPEDQPNRAAP